MEEIIEKYKKYPITIGLILICIIVYVISVFIYGPSMDAQQGLHFGAYNPLFVFWNHDYYRLLTANFVHFGLLHIIVNCYSLYGLGIFVESVLKMKRYLIVIICSALATSGLPYLLYLFKYTVAVFRHLRIGHQILLWMVVTCCVVAGNQTQDLRKSSQCS